MAHAQQQVLSRLQLAANPEGGEAIVLRPRSAPTPVATAGSGYQPPQPPPGQPGPPSPSHAPPPPSQRGAPEGGWPFAGQGEGRPSGGPSGGTSPRAHALPPASVASGSPGDGGSLVGGPGALTPADLVPLAEALQEHERFRVVALQTLQVLAPDSHSTPAHSSPNLCELLLLSTHGGPLRCTYGPMCQLQLLLDAALIPVGCPGVMRLVPHGIASVLGCAAQVCVAALWGGVCSMCVVCWFGAVCSFSA